MKGWLARVVVALLVATSFIAASESPSEAAGTPFEMATHNIQYSNWGASRYVAEHDRPIALAAQEVCAASYFNLTAGIQSYGYRTRFVAVTYNGSSQCNGDQLYNVVYSLAAESSCGFDACGVSSPYPSNFQDPGKPNERRGYACIRASYGYTWVACSTHLSVNQAYAVYQSWYYRDSVLGVESNLRVKLAAGDFNLRPRSYGPGTHGLQHFYDHYREADNYYYNLQVNNSTRNPPANYPSQKIDYVFAGRFWTLDAYAVQDRRCATGSDHCLILGTFRWAS